MLAARRRDRCPSTVADDTVAAAAITIARGSSDTVTMALAVADAVTAGIAPAAPTASTAPSASTMPESRSCRQGDHC